MFIRSVTGLLVALVVELTFCPLPAMAQESDPDRPGSLALSVDAAQLIVLGTFKVDWPWPSLHGWQYSGEIQVERVLKGKLISSFVPFRWVEPFHWSRGCLVTCEGSMSRFRNRRGIWLLTRSRRTATVWELSGGPAAYCGDLPLRYHQAVITAIHKEVKK
jgi:hypothetical protein